MAKLQGGYVAKQCPARAQWDTVRYCEPLPASPFLQRLFKRGRDFESEVVAQLLELRPDALTVTPSGPSKTLPSAIWRRSGRCETASRSSWAADGRLPADPVGRWVGEPDFLVATAGAGRPTSLCSWPSREPPPLHAGPGLPLHSGGLPAASDGVVESKAQAASAARRFRRCQVNARMPGPLRSCPRHHWYGSRLAPSRKFMFLGCPPS
jgi:hypothetical protein